MTELVHATAERTAAAAILAADDGAQALLKVVAPSDFSSQQLQIIVEATRRLMLGIEPIDTTAIVTEARAVGKEWKLAVAITEVFVGELLQMDTRRAVAYAHTVKRFAWLRNAQQFSQWFVSELDSLPDPEELYTAAQKQLDWLKPPTQDNRFVYGWDTANYGAVLTERQAQAEAGTTVTFDYPWSSWTSLVKPLRPGMVGLLAGPEGSGKTSYLEMIAEHWARKAHVVFVHLENNHEYTLDRRMARHARIGIDRLEEARLTYDEHQQVQAAHGRMAAFVPQLHYFDAAGMTMGEILTELRARHNEGICDAVILDYLNKVRASRGQVKLFADNLVGRQSDDMEQFKSFCETAKVVGMTAAQYNKEGKKDGGRKRSWDIRGSGELADKAQLIVLLEREVLETTQRDIRGNVIAQAGEDSPVVKLRIDKQNRGKKGEFEQVYRGEYFTIGDKAHV